MDLLSHALSGLAVSALVASRATPERPVRLCILITGLVVGILPDCDALSLGFPDGEAVYFGHRWYSHHQFFHSLAGGLILATLFLLMLYLRWLTFHPGERPIFRKNFAPYLITFCGAFIAHLLGDLPTPEGPWGGIRLFWPHPIMVGGWGKIWWWNNYDLFLILFCCAAVSILTVLLFPTLKKGTATLIVAMLIVSSFGLITHQVVKRPFHFSRRVAWAKSEENSIEIQKKILGKHLYAIMKSLDDHLPFWL